ncbi:MAG: 50S ribosomal protein L32 [Chloroflexi bacterium]|nr:MAG: 50S ribosomal protein L32 [Chloroflexota bacterium]
MAVPKKRTPPSKQGTRRSHHHVEPAQIMRCSQCRSPRANHRICPTCGMYNGRQVMGPAAGAAAR